MRILDLFEKRSNPTINPKAEGHEAAVKFLSSIPESELPQYGVSMTTIAKLGINPSSKYSTPIGIYFYPADFYIKTKKSDGRLPFMDDAGYIQVIKVSGNPLNLTTISSVEKNDILSKLKAMAGTLASLTLLGSTGTEHILDMLNEYNIEAPAETNVETPGGELWFVLYRLSNELAQSSGKSSTGKSSAIVWNKIIRLLGYDYVIDNGSKIIHASEPSQGFVVKPSAIQLIKTYSNPEYLSSIRNRFYNTDFKASKLEKARTQQANKKLSPWQELYTMKSTRGTEYVHLAVSLIGSYPHQYPITGNQGIIKAFIDKVITIINDNNIQVDILRDYEVERLIGLAQTTKQADWLKAYYVINDWSIVGSDFEHMASVLSSTNANRDQHKKNIIEELHEQATELKDWYNRLLKVPSMPKATRIMDTITQLLTASGDL